ncbi:MAG: RAMP superfamily CRISPR-associated protein [Promethearchaeota archaeon]
MKLMIKTLSHALIGSGEGSGIIDSDIIFDDLGIPYIPSRRIKGLLRKSLNEVCEILDINKSYISEILGESGFKKAKISISNLYIEEYDKIREEIIALKEHNDYKNFLTKDKLLSYFTIIRQQTGINEEGIAEEHSLRTFRVLKSGLKFFVELNLNSLTDYEKALLYLACLNFRRLGTARSKGFGEIKCKLDTRFNFEEALKVIKNNTKNFEKKQQINNKKFNPNPSNDWKRMSYLIKTLSPVLLTSHKGGQNTVRTNKYISSLTVRGLLANKYIKLTGIESKKAHEDKYFYELFLNNKILINFAYPFVDGKVFYPTPFTIQEEKGKESNILYNILISEPLKNTKAIHKFCYIDDNNKILIFNPKTIIFFHNRKKNYRGGESPEDIFYYEAISKDQGFKGFIYGDENYLKEIKNLFGYKFKAEIGRSKSAQYGQIEFIFGEIEDFREYDFKDEDELILAALSPIILYNENGLSEISNEILKKYLENYLKCNIKEIKSIINQTKVENYVGIWNSKSPRDLAFAIGSTFLLKLNKPVNDNVNKLLNQMEIEGIGAKRELGYGRVKINWMLKDNYEKEDYLSRIKQNIIQPEKSKKIIQYILKSEIKQFFENKGFEKAGEKNKFRNISLSNSLINKIETFLKDSKNENDFNNKIEDIKDDEAIRNLKNVINKDLYITKIYDELSNKEEFNKYRIVSNKINFILDQDDFKFQCAQIYWLTFFRYLRLLKKNEGN